MATRTAEMKLFNIEAEMVCLLDEMSDADLRSFADIQEDSVNDEQIELHIYICLLIFKRTRSAEPLKQAILRTEGWIQEIASDHPDRGRRFHILDMMSAKMSQQQENGQQNRGINDLTTLTKSLGGEIANMNHLYGLNDDAGMSLARILEVQRLSNLGVFYGRKFEEGGSMADLNLAVEYNEKALAATPATHPDRYCFLNNVGYTLSRRYELTGKIADLDHAIELSRKAIDGAPLRHPDRGLWLRNLGYMLGTQFMRTGDIENLNQAIKFSEDAVAAASPGDDRLADWESSLGIWLFRRFERIGMMDDIHRAIEVNEKAIAMATPINHFRAARLGNLANCLEARFEWTKAMGDLNRAIEVIHEAIRLFDSGHPYRPSCLIQLGNMLSKRSELTGSIVDLDRAVEATEEALKIIPPSHHNWAEWSSNLAVTLGNRFKKTRIIADLNSAIQVASMAVEAMPQDHPGQSGLLSNLGNWLGRRFEQAGSIEDLDRAIEVASIAVEATPQDHPNRAACLSNLGSWLDTRFEQTGSIDDLNRAIEVASIAVDALPQDRPDQATCLRKLEKLLGERYKWTRKVEDLIRAAEVARMAQAIGAADLDETATVTSARDTTFSQNNESTHSSHTADEVERNIKRELEKANPHSDKKKQVLIWVDEQLQRRVKLTFTQPLEKLRTILEPINNTWDVRFFADLNDFCNLLDDRIESVLTVTGSSPLDAFATTAASYVSRQWGQRGMEILNWLSQFLLAARRPGSSTTRVLRIHGEDKDAEPVCIELQGQLNDNPPAPLSKCNVAIRIQWIQGRVKDYYALVADVASQLSWIVVAFKEPPEEGLSFSRPKIEKTRDPSQNDEDRCSNFRIEHDDSLDEGLEEDDGTCWHQIFTRLNVAVGFPIPDRPNGMRGVELPFSLMTSFAGVGYPVGYKGGFALKGLKNALFPVQIDPDSDTIGEASAVQWHLFGSGRSRLYMAEAKERDPRLRPIGTEVSPTEFLEALKKPKRHFLGLYQDARVCTGTADARAEMIVTARGQNYVQEKHLRWPIEWNRSINPSLGGGLAGASFGLSTGFRIRPQKERQLRLAYNRNLRQHLDLTRTNFALLYNVQTRVAWLLPQISVVMHLVQAWAKANYPETPIVYPDFDDMRLSSLERAFRGFQRQAAASQLEIDFEHTFKEFSNLLDQLQDNEDLKPAKAFHPNRLAGVDFAQLARMPRTYSILTTNINLKYSGDWPQVLKCNWKHWKADPQPYKVVTLFCSNLSPQPIMPRGTVCSTWYPLPVSQDYLITTTYCLKELAQRYGRDPVKLSSEHAWECGTYSPYDYCDRRSCDRLQKIVKGNGRRDRSMWHVLSTVSDHAAVVFGGDFCIDPQARCNPIVLPHQPALPPLQEQQRVSPPPPQPSPPPEQQQPAPIQQPDVGLWG